MEARPWQEQLTLPAPRLPSKRFARNTLSNQRPHRLKDGGRPVRVEDVPLIKGMLIRGDPQSDIAAFFGTNGGRISEINTGQKHAAIAAAPLEALPPPGPYMAARSAMKARETLDLVQRMVDEARGMIEQWEGGAP